MTHFPTSELVKKCQMVVRVLGTVCTRKKYAITLSSNGCRLFNRTTGYNKKTSTDLSTKP